jgi:nucleotide-binding universal stress UspA family protein
MINRFVRIVVGVDGSVGSLAALRRGVAEARSREAVLLAVLAWIPPGGAGIGRRSQCPPVLAAEWQRDASRRLRTAWDDALGGIPSDVDVDLRAERGLPGQVLVEMANRPGDLLVLGGGRRTWPRRLLGRSVVRYCVTHADCPVLVEPAPSLARVDARRLVRELTLGPDHGSKR